VDVRAPTIAAGERFDHRPWLDLQHQSGAEARALQTLARDLRAAPDVAQRLECADLSVFFLSPRRRSGERTEQRGGPTEAKKRIVLPLLVRMSRAAKSAG